MKKHPLFQDLILICFISALLIIISITYTDSETPSSINTIETADIPQPIIKDYFGFPEDRFEAEHGYVHKNQFLADILLDYNVDYQTIDQLARKSKEIFDVRKIRQGQPYHILLEKDSLRSAAYFIYEADPINYFVFGLRDSLEILSGSRELIVRIDTCEGEIQSSLWNALADQGDNPMLAVGLSEIYQWSIDFFGIQKHDWFKIIYENQFIDTTNIGPGRILASAFGHNDDVYYAFWFNQDTIKGGDYFDEEGNSLRRTFLKAPLRYSRISSKFSNSRLHPVLKIRRPHHGIDYAAPRGTPVYSIGDGVIIKKGYQKNGGGRYLKIKHNSVYTTVYMHLNGYAKGIKSGKRLKQGDLIGYVGSSGLATGPHLDFRVFKNGAAIDPLKMKSPPANPVDSAHRDRYFSGIELAKQSLKRNEIISEHPQKQ